MPEVAEKSGLFIPEGVLYGIAVSICGAAITAWVTISSLAKSQSELQAQVEKLEKRQTESVDKIEKRQAENEKQQYVFQLQIVKGLEEIKGDVKLVLSQGKR